MRSNTWLASAAVIGAALAGLAVAGGPSGAFAQGMMMMDGGQYRGKGGYYYRPPPAKPAPRARRYYYRSDVAPRTCGLYRYWHEGRCLDARTTPPDLK